jgi:hypothetical protein
LSDFFPRQLIGGAPAYDRQHIASVDERATVRPNSVMREFGRRPTLGELHIKAVRAAQQRL